MADYYQCSPYAPPVDVVDGRYDHWLLWRIFKASAALAVFFLACDLVLAIRYTESANPIRWVRALDQVTVQSVESFLRKEMSHET